MVGSKSSNHKSFVIGPNFTLRPYVTILGVPQWGPRLKMVIYKKPETEKVVKIFPYQVGGFYISREGGKE